MQQAFDETRATLYRYRFGSAEFDEARFELRLAGLPVEVQRKPLEILACLLGHAGEVVTRDELLASVWGGRPTVDNVVANAMAKLRAALGEENAARILTQPRVGYRFDGPLERIAVGRAPTSRLELAPGAPVPGRANFLLESMIGHSSANEVWLARHARTHEARVYKFSLDGTRLAALKREVTLARVLRENLGEDIACARILDWNFETPPFFIECEYGGPDLLRWAEAEGRLAPIGLEERLALFLQIADAVAAAHTVGVLHKDLKPANVLVREHDGVRRILLTDFGSGRLLEPGRLAELGITAIGMTITDAVLTDTTSGTLLYLAPELLAGAPPTVASDVYALGVLLYQIVTGDLHRPLTPGWERNLGDALLCEDIARATDGDPAQRLASAGELALRLRTRVERRAERAREQAAESAAREAREALARSRARRPWVAAAMLILAAGLGASLWLYRDARLANERSDAMNEFLNWDVLANTGALKTDTDPDPSMRRVLREAAASVGTRFAQDPASEGWIRLGIGQGLGGLGDYAAAEEQQRRAVALLQGARGPAHEQTLVASYALAMTLLERSKFLDAEAVLAHIDIATGTRGHAAGTAFKTSALRGMLRAERKQCADALADLRTAESIALPESPETAFNRFNVRSWIGESLICLGRADEAREAYVGLLADPTQLEVVGPALFGYAQLGHARALQIAHDHPAAEQELKRGLATLETGIGESDPFTLGQALVVAGGFYADLGRFGEATALLERGRGLLLGVGEQQEKALGALRLLGTIDHAEGRTEEAIEKLTSAGEGLRAVFGQDSPDAQGAGFWLAAALIDAGRIEEARAIVERLDAQALQAALGLGDWSARLDALRARILVRSGHAEQGTALLAAATEQLKQDNTPAWLLNALLR